MSDSIDVQHSCNEVSTIIKWKIENLLVQLPKGEKVVLTSPIFSLYKSRLSFCLEFKSIRDKDGSDGYSSLFLIPTNFGSKILMEVKWKFWLENIDEIKSPKKEMTTYFDINGPDSDFGKPCCFKSSNLFSPENPFIKNDTIFICCEIVQNESQEFFKPIPLNDTEIIKSYYKKNQSDYKNGKLTIQMKNKTFRVKKALLALKSPVFKQMLENENFDETKNSLIKIDDFSPEIMEAFVEFLHLEYITQENVKYAHELLKLSDKYNVIKLKEECTQILSKTLNKDNIFQLLVTCFTHDCSELKEHVLTYLSREDSDTSFNTVMKTKEWKKLIVENELVADEIIDAMAIKAKSFKPAENGEVPSTSNLSTS